MEFTSSQLTLIRFSPTAQENRYQTAVVIKVEPKHYGLYLKKKREENSHPIYDEGEKTLL